MNPQGAMLAIDGALDAPVDAYVDALLAVPAADGPAAPETAAPDAAPMAAGHAPAPESTAQAASPDTGPAHVPIQLEQATVREIAPPAPPPRSVRADAADGGVQSGQRWLRVAIGEDRYAVELLRVQEVVRVQPLIAMRGAASSLLGVMNLRGRVVPVHDLGKWLRCGRVVPDERARIVVLEYQDELVGLLVAAVTDVATLDAAQVEPPTPGTRDRTGLGIARTPGAPPTVLLDARAVFD